MEISSGARLESTLFSLRGAVLTVSSRLHGPVMVFVYGANGRLVKQVSSRERSVDLGAGLAKGVYLALAEASGIRCMKRIAVY